MADTAATERDALVARLRVVIEWVHERDQSMAVELDGVVHELEKLAATERVVATSDSYLDATIRTKLSRYSSLARYSDRLSVYEMAGIATMALQALHAVLDLCADCDGDRIVAKPGRYLPPSTLAIRRTIGRTIGLDVDHG